MATDPNKEYETFEQEQREAGKVKVTSADGTASMWMTPEQAATYNAKNQTSATTASSEDAGGITVSDEQIKLLEDQYEGIRQGINDSYEAQQEALRSAYETQETAMGQLISEAETLRGQKQALDEKAQKREKAYRYISGIGDAISGVANLVGTAHGAANQTQHYNAPEVIQKAEASRKERKLEMDKLKERLDELSAQKTALRSARELQAGELSGKKAAELATAELQRAKGLGDIYTTNATNTTKVLTTAMNNAAALEREQLEQDGSSETPKTRDFDFGNGTGVKIPSSRWTDVAMQEVYNLIPMEERTRTPLTSGGVAVYGSDGKALYKSPTKSEMLADIVKAAKTNGDVQAALKAIEKGSIYDRL